ncbi:MAG: hypothetical protein IJX97_01095 [Clostridia bacterium]|nr:hypothetical protein [Clostridia bacterium]
MANNFLWVTRTEENLAFYADSAPKSNLSLHFASDINPKTKKCISILHIDCIAEAMNILRDKKF